MFDTTLFLGFPLSNTYQQELERISSVECDLLIQNQTSNYLQRIEYKGMTYLGKEIGLTVQMDEVDALHAHVMSLLKKLIPQFPYDQHPLYLLALTHHTISGK